MHSPFESGFSQRSWGSQKTRRDDGASDKNQIRSGVIKRLGEEVEADVCRGASGSEQPHRVWNQLAELLGWETEGGLFGPLGFQESALSFLEFFPETTPSGARLAAALPGYINHPQATWRMSGVRVQAEQKRERGKC